LLSQSAVETSTTSHPTSTHGVVSTVPLTAVPAEASGTFNPLCKVLCILPSLYLCAIGSLAVSFLAMDTHCISNCSPKQLYSWMPAATPSLAPSTAPYETVSLSSVQFQGSSLRQNQGRAQPQAPCSPQHRLNHTTAGSTIHFGQSQSLVCQFIRHYCSNRSCFCFLH